MCLIVTADTRAKKAKRDMRVYKLIKIFVYKDPNDFVYKPWSSGAYPERGIVTYEIGKQITQRLSWNYFSRSDVRSNIFMFDFIAHNKYIQGNTEELKAYKQGFHSAVSIKRLKGGMLYLYNNTEIILECIIPKGSEYVKDDTGLVISNNIKPIKSIKLTRTEVLAL